MHEHVFSDCLKVSSVQNSYVIAESDLADEADASDVGIVVRMLPAEQRRYWDDGRDRPAKRYHGEDATHRPVVDVVDAGSRPVAVDGDGDQVKDGRSATEHVERDERVAGRRAEEPARTDLVNGGEWHHQGGDQQVGDGQRRY